MLRNKKKIKIKINLKEVINNILPIFAIYKIVYIDKQFINLIVNNFKNILLL